MTAPNTQQRDAIMRQTPNGLVMPLPSPLLAMLPDALQGLPMQWFEEPIRIAGVAPNQPGTGQFTTDITHAFAAFYGALKVRSNDNQTDRDADPASFSMTDTQNLQYQPPSVPIDITLTWGSGRQPALWPVPLIVKPNNGIILTVTNQSNANTNNYNFLFMGVLITVPKNLEL